MERQRLDLAASERACQAVSPEGDTCNFIPAPVHCPKCGNGYVRRTQKMSIGIHVR